MDDRVRWFWVGSRPEVRKQLEKAFAKVPVTASLATAAQGDVVVVDALADAAACAGLPMGHVFSGVRALKDRRGVQVYVVVDHEDRIGVQLARFCLADGVLLWNATAGSIDTSELLGVRGDRPRQSVDDLLARLQQQVDASGRSESVVQRLVRFEREDTLLHRLQDPETGLFDGPYATLKLDEEWKRARRFHQPLSLLLLDIGAGLLQVADGERRRLLAEAAGVFLNECRDIDVLARFAPTTFLFLLPGTGPDGASVLARRMLAALRSRVAASAGLRPVCGLACIPSGQIADRKAFLLVAEACLRRAEAGEGDGGLCTSWQ